MLPPTFETPRLFARLPEQADAQRLFASYTRNPEVSRYMVWRPHTDLSETEAFIAECIAAVAAGTRLPYVLCARHDTSKPIGMLDARLSRHTVDFGYVLAKHTWVGRRLGACIHRNGTLCRYALPSAMSFLASIFGKESQRSPETAPLAPALHPPKRPGRS